MSLLVIGLWLQGALRVIFPKRQQAKHFLSPSFLVLQFFFLRSRELNCTLQLIRSGGLVRLGKIQRFIHAANMSKNSFFFFLFLFFGGLFVVLFWFWQALRCSLVVSIIAFCFSFLKFLSFIANLRP